MHYHVLTAVTLPERINIPAGEYTWIQLAVEEITDALEKEPDNIALQLAQKKYRDHLIPIEHMAYVQVSNILEPFGIYTENSEYRCFSPCEDSDGSGYETETVDCVRLPDGRILLADDWQFDGRYELFEGKVYQKDFGPLHHRKRTKRAKRFRPLPAYPVKKLYPSVREYMEQYWGCVYSEEDRAYGYYENPNAFWDWFEVGGRWPHWFLVKEDCLYAVRGGQNTVRIRTRTAPEGYQWVAGARKRDIAWDEMKQILISNFTSAFRQLQCWFASKEVPEEQRNSITVTEEGVLMCQKLVYQAGDTLEDYLCRAGYRMEDRYFVKPYAFVGASGWADCDDFHADGGALGMCWNQVVQDFIAGLPEDTLLVSVDCHN